MTSTTINNCGYEANLTEIEQTIIRKLYTKAKSLLKIKRVILGSKWSFNNDSDLELIVLTEKKPSLKDKRLLSEISAEISIHCNLLLGCLYFNELDWREGKRNISPLLRACAEKDGIEIKY